MKNKKFLVFTALLFIFIPFITFAQEDQVQADTDTVLYRIESVTFSSQGKTKPSAVKRNLPKIDTKKIFESKNELEKYIQDFKQEIENLRAFEDITAEYTQAEPLENGIIPVSVTYTFKDSLSLLALPKPGYSSNSGAELKLKLKDENFLGTLNPLNIDINAQLGDKDDPNDFSKINLGFNFDYDYPFTIGITENSWSNSFEFSWDTSTKDIAFDYQTGITIGIPFEDNKLNIAFFQSVIKDPDYKEFNDELYFVEKAKISMPLVLGYISSTTAIKYTPSVTLKLNWDKDGINELNTDLRQSPLLSMGQSFSVSHINWRTDNSFRNGYAMNSSQSLGWDYHSKTIEEKVTTYVDAEIKFFRSSKYLGLCLDAYFFAGLNTNQKIGSTLRGALDYQKFSSEYSIDSNNYALETPCALTLNIDIPIHIITTHWLDWGYSLFGSYDEQNKFVKAVGWLPHKLGKYVDFEMQFSPFIDIGFIKNRGTEVIFSYKDAIYCGGVEVLVYPQKWKSYVVRASVGFDLGNMALSKIINLNTDWRTPAKNYEFYFGLGRHF